MLFFIINTCVMGFAESTRLYFKSLEYKASIKALLPYFIGVLSGITTYFFYAYFNRDIVTIQSALVRQKDLTLALERPLSNKLGELLNGGYSGFRENSNEDLTSLDKVYILEVLKVLTANSANKTDIIDELTKAKNLLMDDSTAKKDSLSVDAIDKLIDDNRFRELFSLNRVIVNLVNKKTKNISREMVKSEIIKRIDVNSKSRSEIDEMIKSIAQKTKRALELNNDKFQIEIIAFNDGNQQTVIRNKGSLVLGQTQLNLKKVTYQKNEDDMTKLSKIIAGKYNQDGTANNYLIVQPKSFIVMNLEMDAFNNKDRDIRVIQREYLSGQSNVELTLYDIKNQPIKPFVFLLQNDIEFEPNDELRKYIQQLTENK